jgi:hypothetical protein
MPYEKNLLYFKYLILKNSRKPDHPGYEMCNDLIQGMYEYGHPNEGKVLPKFLKDRRNLLTIIRIKYSASCERVSDL